MKFIAVALFAVIAVAFAENQDQIAKMIHSISKADPNGFKYSYILPDGNEAEAIGEWKQIGDKSVFIQRGHYQHIAPNGVLYIVSYVADETGYHPTLYVRDPVIENPIAPKKDSTK